MDNFNLKKFLIENKVTYNSKILKEDVSQEIQSFIDKNDFLKGKVKANPADIVEGNKFVLLFSGDAAKHIVDRHLDKTKPGSLFKSNVNLRDVAKKLLNMTPSEEAGGRVKWLGVNGGNAVGEMGVAKASPEEIKNMKDYTMTDGAKEQVKIAAGKRKPTSEVSLITAELGTLADGRKALSLITMFPGGMKVDGIEIPMNRGEFASKGLYFVVDPSSPLLKEDITKRLDKIITEHYKQLNENLTQQEFEQVIDKYVDLLWDEMFYGSGPDNEDEEEQLRRAVSYSTQEELSKKYPGLEVDFQTFYNTPGVLYFTKGDEDTPHFEYHFGKY